LLFIVCKCSTIEIIEMLMVTMIPCDGHWLVTSQNTTYET
jgi:hypothetical protein